GIVGVGVVAILLIIIGAWLPLPHDWKWGLILAGIGILLALVAGATFSASPIVGTVFGIAALVVFGFALKAFSNAISPKPQALIPMPTMLLSLSGIGFLQ
ncbi:MAG: hypothetical protein NT134_01360, partial [Chloroflexi bacterium]|nr:hypothetical protein [Chloroflexota bacterium]